MSTAPITPTVAPMSAPFARFASHMGLDLVAILGDGADGTKFDVVIDFVPLFKAIDGIVSMGLIWVKSQSQHFRSDLSLSQTWFFSLCS